MQEEGSLKVYLFNVGAGDHILLEFPNGELGIIDSFFTNRELLLEEPPGLTYLRHLKQNLKEGEKIKIAFLCITHADLDHLKGLDVLLTFLEKNDDKIILENIWLFAGKDIDEYRENIIDALKKYRKTLPDEAKTEFNYAVKGYEKRLTRLKEFIEKWRTPSRAERYLDDIKPILSYSKLNISVNCLGPLSPISSQATKSNLNEVLEVLFEKLQNFKNPEITKPSLEFKNQIDRNSVSSILHLKYGKYDLVFGGDATKEAWESSLLHLENLKPPINCRPDFLKASHHGSRGSSSPSIWGKLLKKSKANFFVGISAGKRHQHPNDEIKIELNEYCTPQKINARIYRTNECSLCHQKSNVEPIPLDWFQLALLKKQNIISVETANVISILGKGGELVDKSPAHSKLLAYVFEFPALGDNSSIRVIKGVSINIGEYTKCVFEEPSAIYCLNETVAV